MGYLNVQRAALRLGVARTPCGGGLRAVCCHAPARRAGTAASAKRTLTLPRCTRGGEPELLAALAAVAGGRIESLL